MLARLSRAVSEQVAGVWRAVEAGDIAADVGADLVAILVELGNAQGQGLALEVWTQERAEALGQLAELAERPAHALDGNRLREAVGTVLDGDPLDVSMRLSRLALSEAADAFTSMTRELLRNDPRATGWTRGMNTGACELCVWWSRGDQLWPANHVMPTHKGCQCRQVPAWTDNPEDVEYIARRTRQIDERAAYVAAAADRRAAVAGSVAATRAGR